MVQDHHHAHVGQGIAVIASIDYANLKGIGVTARLAADLSHLLAGAEDVVETLNVNVLTES